MCRRLFNHQGCDWYGIGAEMKVNHNTICKEGIKIVPRVGFSIHGNELFILILISKCNPNRVVNEKRNGLSILTPPLSMFQKHPKLQRVQFTHSTTILKDSSSFLRKNFHNDSMYSLCIMRLY